MYKRQAVTHAYQVGYRLFDTAQMYENEAALGKALKELNQPRDNYFITTKVEMGIRDSY